MKKLTVLVDVDDVIWDFLSVWVQYLNRMSGKSFSIFDITEWRIDQFYPSLQQKQMMSPLSEKDFWSYVQPMPGAQDTLKKIIDDGHRVVLVTASGSDTLKYKVRHLLSLFPFFSEKDIIIAHDKSLIYGDVMIDDGPHNLEHTSCVPVLFSRPHNLSCDAENRGWNRVDSWSEIYRLIKDLSA